MKNQYKRMTQTFCILLMVFGISFLAHGGPLENTVNRVETKVINIKKDTGGIKGITNTLNDLPTTVQSKLDIDLGDIKRNSMDAIEEIKSVIAIQKARLDAFGDGSVGDGCYNFRESIKNLSGGLALLMIQLNSVGEETFDSTGLGDVAILESLPCKILLGPSIAFERTPIGDLVDSLGEASNAVQVLLSLYIPNAADASLGFVSFDAANVSSFRNDLAVSSQRRPAFLTRGTEPVHSEYCEVISLPASRNIITASTAALTAFSISLQIYAAWTDTEVFSGALDTPKLLPKVKEVDGGVWGFAHVTISREKGAHKIAKGLNTLARILDAISASATNTKRNCIATHNAQVIFDSNEALMQEICTLTRFRSTACQETRL